jgi:hypothetical protein
MLAAPQQPLLTAQSQPAPAANQVAETDAASKALAVVAAGGTR